MNSLKVHFSKPGAGTAAPAPEPTTCVDAEPFALRVLDDSMEPEFRNGCVILIDPTGVAKDGAYVLARSLPEGHDADETDGYVFRQLRKFGDSWTLEPLNRGYESLTTRSDLGDITGVIVQRAGVRRSYHKRYD